MYKLSRFLVVLSILNLSCDKEVKRVAWLNGEWELVDYYELNSDATRKLFFTKIGSAQFTTEKKQMSGELTLHIFAIDHFGDTTKLDYSGKFEAKDNAYYIRIVDDTLKLVVEGQTKKDLHLTANYLISAPLSDMVFKKKD